MKHYIKICCALLICLGTSCQESKQNKVPQVVAANFISKYPGENNPDWNIDDNGLWEASFKIEGEKYRADFEPNGLWVETENSIKVKELPQAVQEAIERDHADEEIAEVEKVVHHSKGLFYDVEFKKKGKNMDVEYKSDGQDF